MLTAPGEYHVSAANLTLSFIPPEGAKPGGSYYLSRLGSVVTATGVKSVSFENLEIRHSRGAGVQLVNSTDVVLKQCTVSDHGMMGLNISGGERCGIVGSEIAGNGDAGVVLDGGDRISLTPSKHFARTSTIHHNQRWIMNYAPDVFMGGVGNSVEDSDICKHSIALSPDSTKRAASNGVVFFRRLAPDCRVHARQRPHHVRLPRAPRRPAMQRLWGLLHGTRVDVPWQRTCSSSLSALSPTSDGSRAQSILNTTFSNLSSIFPKAHGQTSAVYLDDQLSSVNIEGNRFEDIDGRVMALGGGRHNRFVRNVVKQSAPTQGISMDARGGGGSKCVGDGRLPFSFLSRVPYNTSSAWAKYPGLADILSDDPCEPKHNVISDNVLCGGAQNFSLTPAAVEAWGSEMQNNTAVASCP